jgi:ribosomal protein L44E
MSHPQNCRKYSEEVAISRVQTTAVRALEQMQRLETKTVDEYYTEGKPTCTEVSKVSCSILIIR